MMISNFEKSDLEKHPDRCFVYMLRPRKIPTSLSRDKGPGAKYVKKKLILKPAAASSLLDLKNYSADRLQVWCVVEVEASLI